MIELVATSSDSPQALELIGELSDRLRAITGDDGKLDFDPRAAPLQRSKFIVAFLDGEAVGCGALRPLDAENGTVAEIKRMYSRRPGTGVGSQVLQALEQSAAELGYRELCLETRHVNTRAVRFYLGHGYVVRDNYDPYVGRQDSVCFRKELS